MYNNSKKYFIFIYIFNNTDRKDIELERFKWQGPSIAGGDSSQRNLLC